MVPFVVAYARISPTSKRLKKPETQTKSQMEKIKEFVAANLEFLPKIDKEVIDEGYSSYKKPNYESVANLKALLKPHSVLLVTKWSRITRNIGVLYDFLEFAGRNNIHIITIEEKPPKEESDRYWRFYELSIQNAKKAYISARKNIERKREALQKNYYLGGKISYGYRKHKNKKNQLVRDPQENKIIQTINRFFLKKNTINEIHESLKTKGVRNRQNKPFTCYQIKQLVDRQQKKTLQECGEEQKQFFNEFCWL
uniref:Resolvase/invertase-type recombinase catalytic domain-containing protein n=1 Tax=Cyanoptyche gloeocystis TaxID=77922 RepID=A0A3G1IWI7_9EUKA|nr:hypothetical protein [Cyanoptyche gloeocystis]